MSFIELTRPDNTAILLNKYHISSVSQSVDYPKSRLMIRMNNGQTQEVIDAYDDVKAMLEDDVKAMLEDDVKAMLEGKKDDACK